MGLCDLLWPETGSFLTRSLGAERSTGPPAPLVIHPPPPLRQEVILSLKEQSQIALNVQCPKW